MTQSTIQKEQRMIQLTWADGSSNLFPFIWLRDNDPQGFHPQTLERQFDIASVNVLDSIDSAEIQGEKLVLHWQQENHTASFDLQWLRDNQPGKPLHDPAGFPATLWRNELQQQGVARTEAAAILTDDKALLGWMRDTQSYGLSIVENIADASHAGMDIAKRVGFLRETNFGVEFEVKSKPNPNNLAYTSSSLPLHTDLTNQEVPPGYQFLHCLANEAEGGQSVFCDGFAVAADLRESNPQAFEILATVSIPFRFQDDEYDIRSRKTVINVDQNGVVYEICFNTHIAGILDLAPEILEDYYLAYQAYKRLTQQDKYQIKIKLNAGEMAVFDNRRVLHGRTAFDPNTGYRHLQGCYVDRGEFESRLRLLTTV